MDVNERWRRFLLDNRAKTNDEWSSLAARATHDDCVNTYNVICRDHGHECAASALYISTKTVIVSLNTRVDIQRIFWNIDVIDYHTMEEGVVKKQLKLQTSSPEELASVLSRSSDKRWSHQVIAHADGGQFRDVRKISCGLCRHDIKLKKVPDTGAFSNGLVLTMRVRVEGNIFHEIHVKVFNTGKLEIPGLKTDDIYARSLELFGALYERARDKPSEAIRYVRNTTVLVNSNFTCGYYLDRTRLYNILKVKYQLHTIFDPCSYPGVQSKFYYYRQNAAHNGRRLCDSNPDAVMSFMIFRTGSVLIVGKCEMDVLYIIYGFIRATLAAEHPYICMNEAQLNAPSQITDPAATR